MIALISPSYLKSSVCMEEYSLAQTKHLSRDKLHLIPVCISDGIDSDFAQISHIPMLDARPSDYNQAVSSVCSAVVSWLGTGSFGHLDGLLKKDSENQIDVSELMETLRAARFRSVYGQNLNRSAFPPTCEKLHDEEEKGEEAAGGGGEEKAGTDSGQKDEANSGGSGDASEGTGDDGQKSEGEKGGEEDGQEKVGELGEMKEEEGKKERKGDDQEEKQQEEKLTKDDCAGDNEAKSKPGSSHFTPTHEAKPAEKKARSANVVFSYHQTDAKFIWFLQDLLLHFAPHFVVRSEFSSDQERLDALEAADHIIALLSPNYIESPQHVEEFHLGLWRQRVSPENAPLLIPVQVAVLPARPTYFRLVGCPVNSWDGLWANLHGNKQVSSQEEIHEVKRRIGRRRLPMLSPDELLPMSEVAQILVSAVKAKRSFVPKDPPLVRPALVNTVRLQTELATLTGQPSKLIAERMIKVPPAPASKFDSKSCIVM